MLLCYKAKALVKRFTDTGIILHVGFMTRMIGFIIIVVIVIS